MTTMKLCIELNNRTICFRVPLEYSLLWWLQGPWITKLDPEPEPWIIDEQLNPRIAQELVVLASIMRLSGQLSPASTEILGSALRRAVEQLELPQGVSIDF